MRVTELSRDRLHTLAPLATRALGVLSAALGDDAPKHAWEETTPRAIGDVLTSAALLTLATAGGTTDPRWTALATVAAAAAATPGLGGQDADLDRTAAIRWAPSGQYTYC